MAAITLACIVYRLVHWASTGAILRSNNSDCNYFVIKFNEFIDNYCGKPRSEFHFVFVAKLSHFHRVISNESNVTSCSNIISNQ